MELQDYWGLAELPAVQGGRAQLMLTMILVAVLPVTLSNWPRPVHQMTLDLRPPEPDLGVHYHRLDLDPTDRLRFDGEPVELTGLRARLDLAAVNGEGVDFRPDRNARYETFAETLAVMKRARVERLHLDNRRLAGAID
jgi:biopolymer transport protein ExbD